MESCPKKEIENFKSLLKEENLYLITEVMVIGSITRHCCFSEQERNVYFCCDHCLLGRRARAFTCADFELERV